jgi:hypothetical protein
VGSIHGGSAIGISNESLAYNDRADQHGEKWTAGTSF